MKKLTIILMITSACTPYNKCKQFFETSEVTFYTTDSLSVMEGVEETLHFEFCKIGLVDKAHEYYDSADEPNTSHEKLDADSLKLTDAYSHIIEESTKNNIVIINEAHHVPQHRVFTTRLLKDLYGEGYRYLGLEAFTNLPCTDEVLNSQPHPIITSGYYCSEPQMGNLIREALSIGYTLFSYEANQANSPSEREEGQAANVAAFIKKHKEGKTLIHCGYDHNVKNHMGGSWQYSMAGRLVREHHLEPYTIDQTVLSEKSKKDLEHPLYQALADELRSPMVILTKQNENADIRPAKQVDLYIIHPRTEYINGRANWLLYDNYVSKAVDQTKLKGLTYPILVFLYPEKEDSDITVPSDVIEINNKNQSIHIRLDSSRVYMAKLVDAKNNIVKYMIR